MLITQAVGDNYRIHQAEGGQLIREVGGAIIINDKGGILFHLLLGFGDIWNHDLVDYGRMFLKSLFSKYDIFCILKFAFLMCLRGLHI